jgi:hypothetical protein
MIGQYRAGQRTVFMGVAVEWDDDQQTIIRMILSGHWTLAEFTSANTKTVLMVRTVRHPVYVISDLRTTEHIPLGIFWKLREISGQRPRNWGGGIVISDNGFAASLVDMFAQVYMPNERRLFVVRTNDEAYAAIEKLKTESQVS